MDTAHATDDPHTSDIPDTNSAPPARHDSHRAAECRSQAGDDTGKIRDRWADAGIVTVGLTAGLMSWAAWSHLAEMVGMRGALPLFSFEVPLAWLLPIAVEVFLVTAIRIWQRQPPHPSKNGAASTESAPDHVRGFARGYALAAMAASIAANAAYHALTLPAGSAGILDLRWWIAMITAALPPLMLAGIAHLRGLVTAQQRATDSADIKAVATDVQRTGTSSDDAAVDPNNPATPDAEEKIIKKDRMSVFFWRTVAHGRVPTGQEMADDADAAGSHARAVRRELLMQLPAHLRQHSDPESDQTQEPDLEPVGYARTA
ncbi:hypothetical protein [Fodinicola acaciae]|uniref:hypothetical protein n=1 Tax=Fodinicola acaciae TaxID=2681555 RepID=UPI0013D612C7|nr:hypothetical protein [Fodinicola acaciae]